MPYLGQLAPCSTVLLELGWSAVSSEHYDRMMDDLGWYQSLDINQEALTLALGLKPELAGRGHHRGPGEPDLGLAHIATTRPASVLHYERHSDLIAEVAPHFAHR